MSNKCLYPEFFQYVCGFDVFVLVETHVPEDKIEQYKKYFNNFMIFWKPATRISNYGRASGGCIYGIKKELINKGLRYIFHRSNETDFLKLIFNNKQITILPIYLRGANWTADLNSLRKFITENWEVNMIFIGDTNTQKS